MPDAMLNAIGTLVADRPDGDPDALYELASVLDFLGREEDAVLLYRDALDNGLSGPKLAEGIIQLAS